MIEHKCTIDKNYCKVRNHGHYTGKYRGAARSIYNLKYSIPKSIPLVFHNGSNYNYHSIIKELPIEFEGEINCLGGNSKKY